MQLADHAAVTPFEKAEPGDLLIGRNAPGNAYFAAVRVKPHEAQRDDAPAVVLLSKTDDRQSGPVYFKPLRGQVVLNLGPDWFVDVELDDRHPTFGAIDEDSVLLRVDTTYFLRLDPSYFLDLSTAKLEAEPPFYNKPCVAWRTFSIRLKLPGEKGESAEICNWP